MKIIILVNGNKNCRMSYRGCLILQQYFILLRVDEEKRIGDNLEPMFGKVLLSTMSSFFESIVYSFLFLFV